MSTLQILRAFGRASRNAWRWVSGEPISRIGLVQVIQSELLQVGSRFKQSRELDINDYIVFPSPSGTVAWLLNHNLEVAGLYEFLSVFYRLTS